MTHCLSLDDAIQSYTLIGWCHFTEANQFTPEPAIRSVREGSWFNIRGNIDYHSTSKVDVAEKTEVGSGFVGLSHVVMVGFGSR
jgi:hypothetical protein